MWVGERTSTPKNSAGRGFATQQRPTRFATPFSNVVQGIADTAFKQNVVVLAS
jgi:hypothetical protein